METVRGEGGDPLNGTDRTKSAEHHGLAGENPCCFSLRRFGFVVEQREREGWRSCYRKAEKDGKGWPRRDMEEGIYIEKNDRYGFQSTSVVHCRSASWLLFMIFYVYFITPKGPQNSTNRLFLW